MRQIVPVLVCLTAYPVLAQNARGDRADDPLARFSFSLSNEVTFTAAGDLDGGGDVGVTRLGPKLGIRYAADQTAFLDVAFGAEFSFYDFDGATGVVAGGDPAGEFAEYTVSARYTARANDKWWWFVGGNASWAGEESENLGDGFTGGGMVGATYAVDENLSVGLGVAVQSRLEEDARVFPLPVVNWKINDQWRLATEQAGLRLSYEAFEDWTFFALGRWESRDFRLLDDGPIPDGVMREERLPVLGGVAWTPDPHVEIQAMAGMSFLNQFEFENAAGVEIADPDADPSLMAGVSARIRF